MELGHHNPDKDVIQTWFKSLQDSICTGLEAVDGGATFTEDIWLRPEGGGGRTRVIQQGNVLAKGGVAFSAVSGAASPAMLKTLQIQPHATDLDELEFMATGVSIVLHPASPCVPIIHMNVRYFELSHGVWWFGGGIDLTPHYVTPSLAKDFHTGLKNVCDAHHASYYPEFKQWADDYFYLKHRNETRGIGGIFFDRLNTASRQVSKADLWAFVQSVGEAFVPLYAHQVEQTRHLPFGEREAHWQNIRRGRYVEFNLVWDRGTQFGLQTNGRTESILMSMPPVANWEYNYVPAADTAEAQTLDYLKKGIDWAGFTS